MFDSTIIIPTLDLSTLDLDALADAAWASLVSAGRESRNRECWGLGCRKGVVGVLLPLAERRLGKHTDC